MESTKLFGGKFLEVYVDTIKRNNKEIKWERCSRKNDTKAVMIVPYHVKKNKWIMIQEWRVPINGYEIGFPAGLIDGNESVENAIIREMKEETGLDVININRISPFTYSSSGMTDEAVAIAYVEVDGEVSNKFLEPTEDIIPLLVSKEEIKKLMKQPELKWGSKAWIICDHISQ